MFDPDLSTTVPEKLPVAWPRMDVQMSEVLTQKRMRKNALRTKLGVNGRKNDADTAPLAGQFITIAPFLARRARCRQEFSHYKRPPQRRQRKVLPIATIDGLVQRSAVAFLL
jgi:hypothetical protein